MKPSKTPFRVIRGGRSVLPRRDVFHVSIFEGPPPSHSYVVYAGYGSSYSSDFTFAPVGLPGTEEVFPFPSRASAEAFVLDTFPGVPCDFVSWVSIQMLAAIHEDL